MKKIVIALFIAGALGSAAAQHYSLYYFSTDIVAVKTVYDGRNNVISRQEYRRVDDAADAASANGETKTIKGGKNGDTTNAVFSILNNSLMISMGKAKSGRPVCLDYPLSDNTGNIIVSAEFETVTKFAGKSLKVSCEISDRIMSAAAETVSTPAGSWTCRKSEYDMTIRPKVLGLAIPVKVHVIEWFSPEIGIVRTDVYRNNKLHERRVLSEFRQLMK